MSLKYGLNISKKGQVPARKTILDEDEDEDEFEPGNDRSSVEEISTFESGRTSKPAPTFARKPNLQAESLVADDAPRQDLSAIRASRNKVKAAEELDPSVFDYDSFHDAKTSVAETKKAVARQDAIERKPKYINNLLDAAARRKQDQQIAKEKLLQREREAEGDEFADKEKFVTGAYKLQQEENRLLEAEEKKKTEIEEKRKRQLGGGLQGFYRNMMDETERQHQEDLEAAMKLEKEGGVRHDHKDDNKSDAQLAAELKAKGVNVHLNEEGQVTDKRELLSAGLNVISTGRSSNSQGADHLRASNRPAQSAFQGRMGAQHTQRERQTRMMEEQLAAQAKRAREEEEEERARVERAAKSTKTEKDVSDAKARYLARKAAKEKGES